MITEEFSKKITESASHPTDLKSILEKYPKLLNKENYPVCSNTEQNFIRALLIMLYQESFENFFTERSLPIPRFVSEPLNIRDSVKFTGKLGGKEKFKAQKVLMKPSIGWHTGIIISGPFSGLILDFSITLGFIYKTAVANRVWNNKKISSKDRKYNIKIYDLKKIMEREEFSKLSSELESFTQEIYSKWIRSNPNLKTSKDHMKHLCNELGISVDNL